MALIRDHGLSGIDSDPDLEHAVPLMTRRHAGSARLGLCAGLLVVAMCMAGLALDRAGVARVQHVGVLSNTVQAYAMERLGRPLTSHEVNALYAHYEASSHPKARALLDRFSQKDTSDEQAHMADLPELSDICVHAIQVQIEQVMEAFAKLLIESFFACVLGDVDNAACNMVTSKMDSFLDDTVLLCQTVGDFCEIRAVGMDDGELVNESIATCVPSACHSEAKDAVKVMRDQMGAQIRKAQEGSEVDVPVDAGQTVDECTNCTIDIDCPSAHHPGGVSSRATEDATKLKGVREDVAEVEDAETLADATDLEFRRRQLQ